MVHGLQKRYADKIDFIYLDVTDEATAAAREKYVFLGTPQFVLVDAAGSAVGKPMMGLQTEPALIAALDGLLAGKR